MKQRKISVWFVPHSASKELLPMVNFQDKHSNRFYHRVGKSSLVRLSYTIRDIPTNKTNIVLFDDGWKVEIL